MASEDVAASVFAEDRDSRLHRLFCLGQSYVEFEIDDNRLVGNV